MFKKIELEEMKNNVFTTIGKDWLLVCAEHNDAVNAMTISWGGMGVLWNKNVATIYVRPQRYTKEFIDQSNTFSLMVLPNHYRKELSYLGTVSGRDEDKLQHCHFHLDHIGNTPYIDEAKLVFICRKLYHQPLHPECFIDKELDIKNYPQHDYHEMYVAEIIDVYEKTDD